MVHAAILAEQEVREKYNATKTPMTMNQIEKLSTSRAKQIIDNDNEKNKTKNDDDDEHHNITAIDDETKLHIYSQAFEHAITEAHITAGTLVSSSSSSSSQSQQQEPLHEITFFPDPSILISPNQSHDEEDVEQQERGPHQTTTATATSAIINNNDIENESTPLLSSKPPSTDYGNGDGHNNDNVLGTSITNNTGDKLQKRRPSSSSSSSSSSSNRRLLSPWFQSYCRPIFIILVVLASIVVYTGISNNSKTSTTAAHGRLRFMWWGEFRGGDEGSDENNDKSIDFDKNLVEDDVHVSDSIGSRSKVYSKKPISVKEATGVDTSLDSSISLQKENSINDGNNDYSTTGALTGFDQNKVHAGHDVGSTPIDDNLDDDKTSESSSSEISGMHPTIQMITTASPSKVPTSVPTQHSPSNTPTTFPTTKTLPTTAKIGHTIKSIFSPNTSRSQSSFPTGAPSLATEDHDVASTSRTASPTQLATTWEIFTTEVPAARATATTNAPTSTMTILPTKPPTAVPTFSPTIPPTTDPTNSPTIPPTTDPTNSPTISPTTDPTNSPTNNPTGLPTFAPTVVPTHGPSAAPTILPTHEPTIAPTRSPTIHPTVALMTMQPTLPAIVLLPPLPFGADYFFASILVDDQAFYFPREPIRPKSVHEDPGKGSRMLRGLKLSQATTKKVQHQSAVDSVPSTVNLGWTYDGKTSSLEINAVGQYYLSKGKALQNISSKPISKKKHPKKPPFIWSDDWQSDIKGVTILGKAYEFIGTAVEDHYQEYVQGIEDPQSPKRAKKTAKQKMTWQADWERGLIIAR
jgi:hypothetical protein